MSAALLDIVGHGTVWITGWAPEPAKVELFRPVTFQDVQIGTTDAAGADLDFPGR
jgi:hypothetical protein